MRPSRANPKDNWKYRSKSGGSLWISLYQLFDVQRTPNVLNWYLSFIWCWREIHAKFGMLRPTLLSRVFDGPKWFWSHCIRIVLKLPTWSDSSLPKIISCQAESFSYARNPRRKWSATPAFPKKVALWPDSGIKWLWIRLLGVGTSKDPQQGSFSRFKLFTVRLTGTETTIVDFLLTKQWTHTHHTIRIILCSGWSWDGLVVVRPWSPGVRSIAYPQSFWSGRQGLRYPVRRKGPDHPV